METAKRRLFWVRFRVQMRSQANAMWQWSNFLHDFQPPNKHPLHINFDETNIKLYQDGGEGFLVEAARKRKRTPRSLTNNIPKGQLRGSVTHVCMVCDDPTIQPRLPQLVIIGQAIMTKTEFASIEPSAMPSCLRLMRNTSSWMTIKNMEYLIKILSDALRDVKGSRAIYVYGDAYRAHLGRKVWQAFNREGMNYCIIPAKLTWALQPCDTHVFAGFKNFLATECQRIAVAGARSRLSVTQLLQALGNTIGEYLNKSRWVKAFYDTGLVGDQRYVSTRVLGKLGAVAAPAIPRSTIPSLHQLTNVFPQHYTVPVDLLFVTVERAAEGSSETTTSLPSLPPTTRAALPSTSTRPVWLPGAGVRIVRLLHRVPASTGTGGGTLHPELPVPRLRRLPSKSAGV